MRTPCTAREIDAIRSSSRTIVRELGFMRGKLAGSNLSASAVHAIVEIGNGTVDNANALASLLGLEKSTVSRLLQGLGAKGLLSSKVDASDARRHRLKLSEDGWEQFRKIEAYAKRQVRSALNEVPLRTRITISRGLSAYAEVLRSQDEKRTKRDVLQSSLKIQIGYVPTLLGRVTEMHAAYYAENFEFGSVFERKVASEMAEFLGRIDRAKNAVFSAELNGRIVGSVAIDGEDLKLGVAHLRWFIVDDTARGLGVGKELISSAMEFVDQNRFSETHLWTFKGLETARHLYEQASFVLAEEKPGKQWGTEVLEQMFVRHTPT